MTEDNEEIFLTPEMIKENEKLEKTNISMIQTENKLEISKKNLDKLDDLLQKAGAFSSFIEDKIRDNEPEIEYENNKKNGNQIKNHTINHNNKNINNHLKQPILLSGGILRPHQIEGLRWLANLYENGINGILADEMGLGKTIQVIALIAYLKEKKVNGPYLIVVPLSTLANWINEFKKFTPTIKTLLYHGTIKERKKIQKNILFSLHSYSMDYPVIITSYEVLLRDSSSFTKHIKFKYVIIDEGHRLKNMNCLLLKKIKLLNTENRLLLTGTPIQNNLQELWSLLNFIAPTIFDDLELFESWFVFDNNINESDSNTTNNNDSNQGLLNEQIKNKIISKLHEILRPFLLRRLKNDVIKDIPSKTEIIVYCPMTSIQREYHNLISSKEYFEKNKDKYDANFMKKIKSATTKSKMIQLRKVCNHPFLFQGLDEYYIENDINNGIIEASGKMIIMDKILNKLNTINNEKKNKKNFKKHKVLIFSQWTKVLDILEDYAYMKGYSNVCRIDGSTKYQDRDLQMKNFNNENNNNNIADDDYFIFLLSTRAGGLGINLCGADTVIFYDSDWNPQQDNQAQDRCHRIGQQRPVIVYRLVSVNSFENRFLTIINKKKKLEKIVITSGNFNKKRKINPELQTTLHEMDRETLENILKDDITSINNDINQQNNTPNSNNNKDEGISDDELDFICNREKILENFVLRSKGGGIDDETYNNNKNNNIRIGKKYEVIESLQLSSSSMIDSCI